MAYSVLTDLLKLLPETMIINLSSDQSNIAMVNYTNVAEAIDQADREIDAYLVIAGYTVPADPVPPLITNLSAKMAIWNLHLRKYFDSDIWSRTYKDCLKLLEKIAEGKLSIGQEEDGVELSIGTGHATSSREQKFTEDFMDEF